MKEQKTLLQADSSLDELIAKQRKLARVTDPLNRAHHRQPITDDTKVAMVRLDHPSGERLVLYAPKEFVEGSMEKLGDLDVSQGSASDGIQFAPKGVELFREGQTYDLVMIDTPGTLDNPAVIKSAQEADKIIVPTTPSPDDIKTCLRTTIYLDKHCPDIPKALLYTRTISNRTASKEETLRRNAARMKWKLIPTTIPERTLLQSIKSSHVTLPPADRGIIAQAALDIINV